jgi:hypothetical protein
MRNLQDIKVLVNDFYQKINDQKYIQTMIDNHPVVFTKTVWSKDMAYSLAPLGLELLGFKGSKYLNKKPNVIKHLYEYKLIGDMIREVLVHDKHGQHTATDYLWREGSSVFEMQLDLNNNAYSLTQVIYENNRPLSSLRVDKNKGFWYHEYVYVDNGIKQILSRQYNSDNGNHVGVSHIEYIDNVVSNIHYYYSGVKYNIYTYK